MPRTQAGMNNAVKQHSPSPHPNQEPKPMLPLVCRMTACMLLTSFSFLAASFSCLTRSFSASLSSLDFSFSTSFSALEGTMAIDHLKVFLAAACGDHKAGISSLAVLPGFQKQLSMGYILEASAEAAEWHQRKAGGTRWLLLGSWEHGMRLCTRCKQAS